MQFRILVCARGPLIRLPAPSPRWGEETRCGASFPFSPRGEGGPKGRMRGPLAPVLSAPAI
ncbi:hypothetical protein GFL91_11635 [Rhizobium leguminosarum bv. viciae]|uniref:Uncharacterized protein n=1 Tax=Rhizobium leguminosarum bv. viciae TaxID=387 RepID=A0A4R0BPD2_RHILV|nr:hypothetical protein [Rhizobium leguminosarum bv. viciae]NKM45626.1 hypothetical protein [Rhizobium leguminosarum bv. viciae]TBY71026.1 hypothetical protein E0H32_34420 [Rhizobium leguminosarum bv. viciae]TBZ13010.1 hypothetical protein E0H33_18870 [Rhizobium leguminosarum bv. viciae]TBZ16241.1 hypothetical protein E0H38_18045 [Rhizobium leguminosarum bv. viciae]